MIVLNSTKDIRKVYVKYLESYYLLNWNESLDTYMNQSIKNFYLLKGTMYIIKYDKKEIGHFTIYELEDYFYGMGMFVIPKLKELNFSLGDVKNIINVILDFIKDKKVYGFCINERILDLYNLLGFQNVELQNLIHLVYKNEINLDKINLDIIF
jgi:hypothetical protein